MITSQCTEWDASFDLVKVGAFSVKEAFNFITTNLKSKVNAENINKLIEYVSFKPIALQQAISYINKNRINVEHYLEIFNQRSPLSTVPYTTSIESAENGSTVAEKSHQNTFSAETPTLSIAPIDNGNIVGGGSIQSTSSEAPSILLSTPGDGSAVSGESTRGTLSVIPPASSPAPTRIGSSVTGRATQSTSSEVTLTPSIAQTDNGSVVDGGSTQNTSSAMPSTSSSTPIWQ